MMEISTTQFQAQCLQLIEEVHTRHTEIVITKHGKPWAKLISAEGMMAPHPFLGSLVGVGNTIEDLLEPVAEEWECE
jgi:prevent-host-death family protein